MPPVQPRENADRLLEWIRQYARDVRGREMELPLPATRKLGDQFSVSNSTAFRMLEIAEGDGTLWRKPNGRFYLSRARTLVERPKPLACLFRRLENWSAMYRDLMEGICASCGESGLAVMLWPDASLVQHESPSLPPRIADVRQQRTALDLFLRRYGAMVGGMVWDHDWDDQVIAHFAPKLPVSVMACRKTALASVGHVSLDYDTAAIESVGFLLGRGYETIQLVEPFTGDPAVNQILAAFAGAIKRLSLTSVPVLKGHSPEQRSRFIDRLKKGPRKSVLICPEDNIALELSGRIQETGLDRRRAGVLAAQGSSIASNAGLTRLECDYRQIGRECISMIRAGEMQKMFLPTRLMVGSSTC